MMIGAIEANQPPSVISMNAQLIDEVLVSVSAMLVDTRQKKYRSSFYS